MSIYFWIFLPLWIFVTIMLCWLFPHMLVRRSCVGDLVVTHDEDKLIFTLDLDEDPFIFEDKTFVSFRVRKDTQDNSSL